MGQQGIYVAPCNSVPNRDRETKCEIKENARLWILEFTIKGGGKGCAVVKAKNSNNAARKLLSEGQYNGNSTVYEVTRIEEILESPDEMLICEQIIDL